VIGPVTGLLATFAASPRMLKVYVSMNATMALVNYPLTLLALIIFKDKVFYVGILILLFFNKICLSFYGSKIRQHFANPGYAKNQYKMQKTLVDELAKDPSGRFKRQIDPAEKAASLIASGKPNLDQNDSDDDDIPQARGAFDDQDDAFGITPTSDLKKDATKTPDLDFSDPTAEIMTKPK